MEKLEMNLNKAIHIYLHPYANSISGVDINTSKDCIVTAVEEFLSIIKRPALSQDPKVKAILKAMLEE